MRIVTAGMHHIFVFRFPVNVYIFAHRQRIHVGAQSYAAFLRISTFDTCQNACARNSRTVRYLHVLQLTANKCCGFMFLKRKFGVSVQMPVGVADKFLLLV
jgi:hypothetical protein